MDFAIASGKSEVDRPRKGGRAAMSQPSKSPPSDGSKTRAALFEALDRLGIKTRTVSHQAIFTVEEGRDLKRQMPGGHSKNLFLKFPPNQ